MPEKKDQEAMSCDIVNYLLFIQILLMLLLKKEGSENMLTKSDIIGLIPRVSILYSQTKTFFYNSMLDLFPNAILEVHK